MIRYLWRLFVVGFPEEKDKCAHIWETINTIEERQGNNHIGTHYTLKCSKCGEIKLKSVHWGH